MISFIVSKMQMAKFRMAEIDQGRPMGSNAPNNVERFLLHLTPSLHSQLIMVA